MKHRILVVDDDLSILELLRFLLEGDGYRVSAFDSAANALKAAIANPPDVAIVDLMMPGMNGLELVQALRYDTRTQHIPVLLCSAYYGDLHHITTNLKLNNISSLRKPFQIQELLDKVERMISDNSRQAEANTDGVKPMPTSQEDKARLEPAATLEVQADPNSTLVPFAALKSLRSNAAKTCEPSQDTPRVAAGRQRGRRG